VAKRTALKSRTEDGPNPRQPCPCGSGKRYKACHGANGGADVLVARPFEGFASECELVALREFVPSATVALTLTGNAAEAGREITLATVLPMAAAGLVRAGGEAMVGMQVQTRSGDVGSDLARAILWASTAEPGESLPVVGPNDGIEPVKLSDVVDPKADLTPRLHNDFSWWIPSDTEPGPEVNASLERANQAIMPTERLEADGVHAAYWVQAGDKAHLRWVRSEPEEDLLKAMARLAATDSLSLGEGSKYAGSFRAHGVLVPVWDLDAESHAREWAEPASALGTRLTEALASLDTQPLTEHERRARDGLRGRQVTLR
jgi:hypothetical protein